MAILAVAAGGSAATGGDRSGSAVGFQRLDPAQLQQARNNASKWLPASLSSRQVNVMLQFGGAPVAVQDAKSKSQGHGGLSNAQKDAIRGQLKAQQDQARGQIEAKGGQVLYQLADAYNGVIVHTQMKDVGALSQVSGVVAVRKLQEFRPANTNGVPYVGGPQAWAGGLTGTGVTIADIDTGIDYTHADFGGPGTASAWNDAVAHSTDPPNPSFVGPAAPKVKGGFDLVGDDYNADPNSSSYQPVPHPDPNPLDCNGHGTHTAGTAAGDGVLDDGSTYTGPYGASTVSGNTWDVGPGVAPQADLLAYRVFGCAGSSDVVAAAIDRAVAGGADVITMSLGSTFGDPSDPTAVASQNAVDDGVVVVAAAGNDGPSAYMTGSPASASGVLAVAAMDGSVPSYPGALIAGTTSDAVIDANGAVFGDGTTMPVKVLWADPAGPHTLANVSLGCDPAEYTNAGVTGDLVIVQRGTCARVARAIYGQQAGAAAVLMINSANSYPPFEGKIISNPDTGEPYTVTIPFFGAKKSQASHLLAEDGVTVTLTNTTVPNTGYGQMASFSSGGPRNLDSSLKPEIAAPGVSVASAGMGTGTNSVVESGTSMATPMTSGSAALVLQAHPDWTPAEVKAALMDTASNTAKLSGYDVRLAGAGVVQAEQAAATVAMATTADGLDSLSYGYDPAGGAWSATKTITLHNTSASDLSYDLAAQGNGDQSSSVSISPSHVTVGAHSTADVDVTMSLDAAAVAALPSVDTSTIGLGKVLTSSGNVVATPTTSGPGIQTLHIPYLAVPRGLAGVTASLAPLKTTGPDTLTSSISLTNAGIHAGNAELYTWGIHDAADVGGSPVTMDVRDAGVEALPGSALGGSDSDRSLVFAVNDYSPVTSQSLNEYDVAIITKGHVTGYVIGVDLGLVLGGAFDGIPASFTIDAAGNVIDAWYADAPMNGSTVELPAVASELGIDSAHSSFDYTVTGFSLLTGAVDPTGTATFDPFTPGESSGNFVPLDPGATASFPVTVTRGMFNKQRELGWLVVSLDNPDGAANAREVPVGSITGNTHP